jgi:hypothetical protein
MKRSIAKLWTAALRSGDYKQGRSQLRNVRNEFCCLGVLCNLHAQAHPKIARAQYHPGQYLGCTTDLPLEVAEWAEVRTFNATEGDVKIYPGSKKAAAITAVDANDHFLMSFGEIADLIDANWKTI